MRFLVGTSGFSYPAWRGRFYPADVPPARMLAYYAGRFPTVEINATFYRLPSASTLAHWRDDVPSGFSFAMKAPQRITHQKRLRGADDLVSAFYRAAAELGANLGPVLFQLPPTLKKDVPLLVDFLAQLPGGGRSAFEFRHPSWFDDLVFETLRSQGAALCVAEAEELEVPLVPTADFGYLRLREPDYDAEALESWAERIREQPWREVFVFFKHEDEARGPRLADALASLLEAQR